jgi:hypothetical protein
VSIADLEEGVGAAGSVERVNHPESIRGTNDATRDRVIVGRSEGPEGDAVRSDRGDSEGCLGFKPEEPVREFKAPVPEGELVDDSTEMVEVKATPFLRR